MADVQTEHGATMIANALIREVFMKGLLSKTQLQIVFCIIDESWSWVDKRRSTQQKTVKMKVTRRPLKASEIAKKTGVHLSDVCKQVAILLSAKVIRRHWDYYQFNKDYDKWDKQSLVSRPDKKKAAAGVARPKNTREIPQSTRENTQQEQQENQYESGETGGEAASLLGKTPSELGENPSEVGEPPTENDKQIEESPLGKFPNGTGEIPYLDWGNSLPRWPAILTAARDARSLNKDLNKELNKVWVFYNQHPDYQDATKPTTFRYQPLEIDEILEYWKVLRFTRQSGKIAPSVIEKEMDYWEQFDTDVVLESLAIHIQKHATKKEDYTRGIMRRMQKEKQAQGGQLNATRRENIRANTQTGRANGAANGQTKIGDDFFDRFG